MQQIRAFPSPRHTALAALGALALAACASDADCRLPFAALDECVTDPAAARCEMNVGVTLDPILMAPSGH